jgi:hypothetical protein
MVEDEQRISRKILTTEESRVVREFISSWQREEARRLKEWADFFLEINSDKRFSSEFRAEALERAESEERESKRLYRGEDTTPKKALNY